MNKQKNPYLKRYDLNILDTNGKEITPPTHQEIERNRAIVAAKSSQSQQQPAQQSEKQDSPQQ